MNNGVGVIKHLPIEIPTINCASLNLGIE